MSKQTQKANPMKPAPAAQESEDNTLNFESEEVMDLAGEAEAAGKLSLEDLVGTGEDGVVTLDDVEKAIESHDADDQNDEDKESEEGSEDTIDFASDEAGEYAHEIREKVDASTVQGTGKDGAITKGDLKKALKAVEDEEKAKADAEAAEKAKAEAAAKAAEKSDEGEEEEERELDLNDPQDLAILNKEVINGLISFGSPVRGALNTKPAVQGRWNELLADANKLKKAIANIEKKG